MAKKNISSRYGARRRRNRRQISRATMLILFAAAVFCVTHYMLARDKIQRQNNPVDGNLEAVVTADGLDEVIVSYEGMTVSFNPSLHIPNWVSYELTLDETRGTEPRAKKFYRDDTVDGCPDPSDYSNSGYDRGHLAPSADMKWSDTAMQQSFAMTNIVPQAKALNRGSWGKLEEKCRARAQRDSAIVIVSGPVLSDTLSQYIGASRVAVPKRFFKVILSPYSNPPVAIGFIMPNGTAVGGMQACAVTVDSVEALTGHDFFPALPDDIEQDVESKVNFHKWSRMK